MLIPDHYVEIGDDALQLLGPTEGFLMIILVLPERHELPEGYMLFVHLFGIIPMNMLPSNTRMFSRERIATSVDPA
jgi:hypothetical protein